MTNSRSRHTLPGWVDPETVFRALYGSSTHAFWLDSGIMATHGMSYLGVGERLLWSDSTGTTRLSSAGTAETREMGDLGGRVLSQSFLTELARLLPVPARTEAATRVEFELGWVGWIGYEEGAAESGIPTNWEATLTPRSALLDVGTALAFDHVARRVTLIARDQGRRDSWLNQFGDRYRSLVGGFNDSQGENPDHSTDMEAPSTSDAHGPLTWRHNDSEYISLIAECQEHIRRGNVYQLCLTNRATVAGSPAPLPVYLRLRRSSPTHHGGYIRVGDHALLSATPEQFLAVSPRGDVRTSPIKGTRPRSASATEDADIALELRLNGKERAENLMIVDLMRNDLQRVSEAGSVRVSRLHQVETYTHVHQLVSTVEARLAPGATCVDVLRASFPAGSMTGAPKLSAMRVLAELEGGPRGVYAGAFGYVSDNGAMDLAMVIRSIVLDGHTAFVGSGGGIMFDSDPAAELAEVKIKAEALLRALLGP